MCPEVYAKRPGEKSGPGKYVPQPPVVKVEIDGNIITDLSRFNPNAPFRNDIRIWVKDKAQVEKLEPFLGGQIVQIKADERGTFNGKPDLVSPTDGRFVDTLTDVQVM